MAGRREGGAPLTAPLRSDLRHQLPSPLQSTPDAPYATDHLDCRRSMAAAASSAQVTPPFHLLVCVIWQLLPSSCVGVGGVSMTGGRRLPEARGGWWREDDWRPW
jgi:hypothetical protein